VFPCLSPLSFFGVREEERSIYFCFLFWILVDLCLLDVSFSGNLVVEHVHSFFCCRVLVIWCSFSVRGVRPVRSIPFRYSSVTLSAPLLIVKLGYDPFHFESHGELSAVFYSDVPSFVFSISPFDIFLPIPDFDFVF